MRRGRPVTVANQGPDVRRSMTIAGRNAWHNWLEEVAHAHKLNKSEVIDLALEEFAERYTHPEPPQRIINLIVSVN